VPSALHLDQKVEPATDLHRKVAKGAADAELRGEFAVLIVAEHVGEKVRDDHRRVRLVDIPVQSRFEDLLVPLEGGLGAIEETLRYPDRHVVLTGPPGTPPCVAWGPRLIGWVREEGISSCLDDHL
jgi:hypothetical protein